jgi:RNA polymerase sigma-70 factor (ECF subfamily)
MLAMTDEEPGATAAARLSLGAEEFRAFYGVALPRVFGYLARRCGSAAVAEDLTQETFLAAVVELSKARRVEEPLAWILGIARHKLLDHYRRQERRRARETIRPDEPMATPHEDQGGRATTALAAVPHEQRIALVLRHVDGLSVPEVAVVLGRSVEAVESLLARGRTGFRRAYSEAAARCWTSISNRAEMSSVRSATEVTR